VSGAPLERLEAAPEPSRDRPVPEFEVNGVEPVERAMAPTLRFRIRVMDPSQRPVYTIAASVLITVEPSKRSYDEAARERLVELFGAPERWATTTTSFRWAQADVLVPSFRGETTFDLPIACTYDHEIAAGKYFGGLDDGEAPLRFHFNGTIIYEGEEGTMQLLPIPWDCSVRYSMPLAAWKRMISLHYSQRGWIPLDAKTVERLARLKADRGAPTFDALVAELLDDEER
jgi:Family of unknown function (DUF6084)